MGSIVLNGHSLTAEQFYSVVYECTPVVIAPEASARLVESRKLLFDLSNSGETIYGLNVGVGWNKDANISANQYAKYNRQSILSHCVGLPPYANEKNVRAALLARLNTMLVGATGLSPEIPLFYAQLLNRKIHPLIPEQGSVGQADLGLMSFVGLTILGEGQVYYKGDIIDAKTALEMESLIPISELGAKDGLSIFSTNGLGLGSAMLVLNELEMLLDAADLIYACSLEALNGNVSPFDPRALELKGDTGILAVGNKVRQYLIGSFLYEQDSKRHLQDPLCFRDVVHIHGAAREMLTYTKDRCIRALNAGEDNPSLILDEKRMVSTSNYDPINWVLGMEGLAIALSHVAHAVGQRTLKLANPVFTELPRFLAPEGVLGLATAQKICSAQYAKIRHLSNPVSVDTFTMAGEIEDKSTNAPYVVQRLDQILDCLWNILALELFNATQGQTFRIESDKILGQGTAIAYSKVREVAPFISEDRIFANDILAITDLLKSGTLNN